MRYLPTGNEMISLPRLRETDAAIEDVTFLHMGAKGLIDIRSRDALIRPFAEYEGAELPLTDMRWQRLCSWLPSFTCRAGPFVLTGTILCPIGERGFAVRLEICSADGEPRQVSVGLRGSWDGAYHCVNEEKPIEGALRCYESGWNGGPVFDMRCGLPLFAFAPMCAPCCESSFSQSCCGADYSLRRRLTASADAQSTDFFWGFGFEEVAAATSAKEMLRQGWDDELRRTLAWLAARSARLSDEKLTDIYNLNLFFCIFYSAGVTLDTEEFVLVTSRSPRYYVSAAYWDRDSLYWSFPAVLDADAELAKRMLEYVFTRQARNFGVHSRFIDGTVLEPGFELDELMAPAIALHSYVSRTGDRDFAGEAHVRRGCADILRRLDERHCPALGLYSTFLQPTDDERVHPYLTYDNALVWRAMRALAELYPGEYAHLTEKAEGVKRSIYKNCVRADGRGGELFAWSVDTDGSYDIYDEPPGSLLLLPRLGFCGWDDPIYLNTAARIRSPEYKYSFAASPVSEIGCPHAPHPWVLSLANSLLCGRRGSGETLKAMPMDNGIACESVDEVTGECVTGEAFATCAGFLCHALRETFGEARA